MTAAKLKWKKLLRKRQASERTKVIIDVFLVATHVESKHPITHPVASCEAGTSVSPLRRGWQRQERRLL